MRPDSREPLKDRRRILVWLVESPEPNLKCGRTMKVTLPYIGVLCRYRSGGTKLKLVRALAPNGVEKAMRQERASELVILIMAHGSESGFMLASGEKVTWLEFRELLLPLNRLVGGKLLVMMHACRGANARKTAQIIGELPYQSLVGCEEPFSFQEGMATFTNFFYHLSTGRGPESIVDILEKGEMPVRLMVSRARQERADALDFKKSIDRAIAVLHA